MTSIRLNHFSGSFASANSVLADACFVEVVTVDTTEDTDAVNSEICFCWAFNSLTTDAGKSSKSSSSVSTVATTVTTSTKQASAKALFADSKLPAKWFNRIDVNSETSVEDQIKELQEEFAEIKQSVIDDEVAGGDYKPNPYKPKERIEQEWLKLMEDEESSDNGTASLGLEE